MSEVIIADGSSAFDLPQLNTAGMKHQVAARRALMQEIGRHPRMRRRSSTPPSRTSNLLSSTSPTPTTFSRSSRGRHHGVEILFPGTHSCMSLRPVLDAISRAQAGVTLIVLFNNDEAHRAPRDRPCPTIPWGSPWGHFPSPKPPPSFT